MNNLVIIFIFQIQLNEKFFFKIWNKFLPKNDGNFEEK